MKYPDGFPDHLKSSVEIAIADAEREYAINRGEGILPEGGMLHLVSRFMVKIFTAFIDSACAAREQGLWDGERFRKECMAYLYSLSQTVAEEKYPSGMAGTTASTLRIICKEQYEASPKWLMVTSRLSIVADKEKGQPSQARTDNYQDLLERSRSTSAQLEATMALAKEVLSNLEAPTQNEAEPTDRLSPSEIRIDDLPSFPKRAAWLKERLRERSWNRNRPCKFGGPDPKTIDKILAGDDVTDGVLERLADALSKKRGKVDVTAIPVD